MRIFQPPRQWRAAAAPLLVAIGFAAAFVLLRLAYRVIFGGWPDTLGMWGSTVVAVIRTSAPFVSVILFCGVVNVVVDFRSALSRWGGRGALRNMRTALVVALSSYPELLSSVTRVRMSRRMRGDRSLGSFMIPILERALERGIALGASMEQRGFGARNRPHGMCDAPVVARNLSIGFGNATNPNWSLDIGDLTISHGSCVLLTGPTGSGKTALLRALTGRLQHSSAGWQNGVLEVGGLDRRGAMPSETSRFVALVEQNVRDGFVASNVFDEIAFGLRIDERSHADVTANVEEIARRVGISELLARDTATISAGEASLVALAAALVTRPSLLLLDEPIADLDDAAAARVIQLLTELHRLTGVTMIIAEHRWAALTDLADVRLDLAVGGHDSSAVTPVGAANTNHVTPLVAPNGAGKTTWLTGLAQSHPRDTRLVPDDPSLLFSRDTVLAECTHNDRLARLAPGTTREVALGLMPRLPMDAHPRDHSTGQRVVLACALQIVTRPSLLLLDEPTRGLDQVARNELVGVLSAVAESGTRVIFATHDSEFAELFTREVSVA